MPDIEKTKDLTPGEIFKEEISNIFKNDQQKIFETKYGTKRSAYFFGNIFRSIKKLLKNSDENEDIDNLVYFTVLNSLVNADNAFLDGHNTVERRDIEMALWDLNLNEPNQRKAAITLLNNHIKYYEKPIEEEYDKQKNNNTNTQVNNIIKNNSN